MIDSSGLKVYGEGEWKVRQHGYSKRRTWRKMHIGIDAHTGEIVTGVLTEAGVDDAAMAEEILTQAQTESRLDTVIADGAYDKDKVYEALCAHCPEATVLIPPRKDAHIWQHGNAHAPPHPRDTNLRTIRKIGRRQWKAQAGYHQRSLIENTMYRYKTLFNDHLTARKIDTQATQFGVRCDVLNRMTALGMPDSYPVA